MYCTFRFMHIDFFNKNCLHAKAVGPVFFNRAMLNFAKDHHVMSYDGISNTRGRIISFLPPVKKKLVQVTAVFCESAIDSAQSDHTMMVQSILDDKAGLMDPQIHIWGCFMALTRKYISSKRFVKRNFSAVECDICL